MDILFKMFGTTVGWHLMDADGNCLTIGEQKLDFNFGSDPFLIYARFIAIE